MSVVQSADGFDTSIASCTQQKSNTPRYSRSIRARQIIPPQTLPHKNIFLPVVRPHPGQQQGLSRLEEILRAVALSKLLAPGRARGAGNAWPAAGVNTATDTDTMGLKLKVNPCDSVLVLNSK